MKLKETKTYRTLLSYLLVLCIVCGLVGSHAPVKTVQAEGTASSYTVTTGGNEYGFFLGNKLPQTDPNNGWVYITYTVKETNLSSPTSSIGTNGVVETHDPTLQYPYTNGSMNHNTTNVLLQEGATYRIEIKTSSSDGCIGGKIYINGERTYELDAYKNQRAEKGGNYFGIYFEAKVQATLVDVTCTDENGNDLGLQSNQSDCSIQSNEPQSEPVSYTVTLNGSNSSSSHYFLCNEKATSGPITLSYTVQSLTPHAKYGNYVGRNGVAATLDAKVDYPVDYGSSYYTYANADTTNGTYTNRFMQVGCTYTLTIGLDDNGNVTFEGYYVDAQEQPHDLTEVSEWAHGGTNAVQGTPNKEYKYFGVHTVVGLEGTLINVTCVDANGNDLGIASNQTGEHSCTVKKDTEDVQDEGYTVSMYGKADNTHYYMCNAQATSGPITLTYTVQELTPHATYGNYVGRNGVAATLDPSVDYPVDYGSSYYTYENADKTNGTYTNRFMQIGCTYTLTIGLDKNGAITFDGSYVDAEGEPHSLTPISDWAGRSGAQGKNNKSYQYFGVHFVVAPYGKLTNVTCVDAEGNDLGITTNQTTCVITGGPTQEQPGDNPEEPDNPEEEYDSTNWVKYNVTLGGSASSLFLSNKTAVNGPIILRYTVSETSAGEKVGNNGVLASTSPTSPFPYAYGNGSMLFNAPTNSIMKVGCTYTLKISLNEQGFVKVSGNYADEAGNILGNIKDYIPRKTGTNNPNCQHFGIYIEKAVTATLTNVSCVDETGKNLGLQVNQLGCTFENLSGDTGDAVVEEKLPSDYTLITLGNFGIKDGTYRGTFKQGFYALSMHKTVFSVDIEFSTDLGEDLRYGSRVDGWHGLRFWSQENNLHMQDVDGYTKTYVFDMVVANMKLVGEKINLKISTEYVDSDSDGVKDDVKLGVWFNDKLYNNEYIYLKNYKNVLGKYMSVYSAAKAAYITVSSVEGVHTGVDYSIWGYTNNWKKEMGIE